jgi:peptide chain release factor subunit 3
MPNFTEEETNDILQDYFLYSKIVTMETDMTMWKESFGVIKNTIKTFLGIIVKEKFNELDILKNQKANKNKKTAKVVQNISLEPTFKPIVFKPEEIVLKTDLVAQALKDEVKMFDDKKEPMILIFIGHVDSGKSTISGNILYLSGKVDETEMRRFKAEAGEKDRESWYVAYIMDINEEEREKGKTIEVGRATFETENKRFTILDCPGHRNYVQNMISGAAQADVACLIVSAKPGEFEAGFEKDGQTREHAMLAKSLGAKHLVVCINKMDTVDWDKARVDYIKQNITPFLVTSCW